MEVERRVKDPLGRNDGCGEWISQRSDRRRKSRLNIAAASDPKVKLLDEETTFPNISKGRQQWLREIFLYCYTQRKGDCTTDIPRPLLPKEEEDIAPYLDAESPIYTQSFLDVPPVGVGKQLDALDLLGHELLCFNTSTSSSSSQNAPSIQPTKFRGNNYVASKVEDDNARMVSTLNLKGKHVMIFCVFVPSLSSLSGAHMIYHTALASHDLAKRDHFVLVVVPMMRKGFTHSSFAYRHFLSGFSCLAVPFDYNLQRQYICSALGFDGKPKALILDPSEKVLYHGQPDMFCRFGADEPDFFPFTPERMWTCFNRDSIHFPRYQPLNEFLGLGDSDVLYDIEYLAGGGLKGGRCITVSELKQKLVGIYLYCDAVSLPRLQEVYEECERRGYELEIVVPCSPFRGNVPPEIVKKIIVDALASIGLLRWWVFPFNHSVCQRLKWMHETVSHEEGLVMVDPNGKDADGCGMPIMCDFGVDGYPFTKRKLLERELERKTGLTVNSLLRHWTHVYCKKKPADSGGSSMGEVPLAQALKDKIVVLYMYKEKSKFLAGKLGAWYANHIKGKVSNVEVVAVSIDGVEGVDDEDFMDRGWLVCPADRSKAAKVRDEYCHPLCRSRAFIVVFGEDGHIQCVDASLLFKSQGLPPRGDLRAQIRYQFRCAGFDYM